MDYTFIKNENGTEEFPLSLMQEYMIKQSERGVSLKGEQGSYTNAGTALRVRMKVDFDRLEKSVNRVINENEMARTIAVRRDGKYTQKVVEKYDFKLKVTETKGDTKEERYDNAIKLAVDAMQSPLDYFNNISVNPVLIKIDEDDFIFAIICNHWIGDGASLGIMINSVFTYYMNPDAESIKAGSFLKYIKEERDFQVSEKGRKQLEYWAEELGGYELVDLSKAAEGIPSEGEDHFFPYDISKPTAVAEKYKTTRFNVMLLAYHIALSLTFGDNDIVVGATSANRTMEYMYTIGFFAHSVMHRMKLKDDDKLSELIKVSMKKHSENMKALQTSYQFDTMQFCITYQNYVAGGGKREGSAVKTEEVLIPAKRVLDKFYLGVYEKENGMILVTLADGEMFREDFIHSIIEHIKCAVEVMEQNDEATVADVREAYNKKFNA